jgi:hypothetical protein
MKILKKIRKMLVAALLANGMSELPCKVLEEKQPGVYPLARWIADLHAPTAHGHQVFPIQLRQVFLIL